ncbi:MAG: recombinase family protein [Planctomycetes bacterium]|nr:recombinase family protein [Planctomycetota bacterium]
MRRPRKKAESTQAVAYVRASTDKQERSCRDQLAAIRARAERDGFEVVEHFEDDGVSGTSLDRPGLNRLRDHVEESSERGRVYVWHRDRVGRVDARELLGLEFELDRAGWPLFPLEGAQRTGSELADGLQSFVEGHAAGQFSRDLAGKTLRGQRRRAEAGELRAGGPCPYGYARRVTWPGAEPTTLPRGQKTGILAHAEGVELVPGDAAEVEIVRELFERYATGEVSYQALADSLNARALPSPNEAQWGASSVRVILSNPVYAGDFAWNRQTHAKFRRLSGGELSERDASESEVYSPNAREDWVVNRDVHEALVARALWNRCQGIRDARGQASGGGRRVATHALTELVRCSDCGRTYTGTRPNAGRSAQRYAHSNADHQCGYRSVLGQKLEVGVLVVIQDVFRAVPPAEWRTRLLKAARRLVPRRGQGCASNARAIREHEAWIKTAVGNLGRVSGAAAGILADQIEERQKRLEALRVQTVAEVVPVTLDPEEVAEEALELVYEVATLGLDMSPASRRQVYQLVLEAVVPRFERVEREGRRALNRFLGATLTLTGEARGVLLLNVARAR